MEVFFISAGILLASVAVGALWLVNKMSKALVEVSSHQEKLLEKVLIYMKADTPREAAQVVVMKEHYQEQEEAVEKEIVEVSKPMVNEDGSVNMDALQEGIRSGLWEMQ